MNRLRLTASVVACVAMAACGPGTPRPFISALSGSVVANPASVSFNALGAGNAQTVTVSEPGYAGPFGTTSQPSCAGIATIAPSSGTSFTVVPVAAGSCTFVFSSPIGNGTLAVVVTTTSVGGS